MLIRILGIIVGLQFVSMPLFDMKNRMVWFVALLAYSLSPTVLEGNGGSPR
jgi:hypothetical protein